MHDTLGDVRASHLHLQVSSRMHVPFLLFAFSLALYFKRHLSIAADENKESFTILPLVLLLLFAFSIFKTPERYQITPQAYVFIP